MLRTACLAALAAVSVTALAAPAYAADKRMVTFDSASSEARRLTGAGLTFVFTRQYFRTNILAVRATAVPVGVVPTASHDGDVNRQLDALMGPDAGKGELYAIDPAKAEGKVMIAAFCPGATKGWLAIGPVYTRKPLRVHAFGDDGQGGIKLCSAMDFTWRGEWQMPKPKGGNTRAAVTKPNYGRPDGSR